MQHPRGVTANLLLQAGSLIVHNLRTYGQPVIVYLPPGAELRGGAWVVIDGQINPAQVTTLVLLWQLGFLLTSLVPFVISLVFLISPFFIFCQCGVLFISPVSFVSIRFCPPHSNVVFNSLASELISINQQVQCASRCQKGDIASCMSSCMA